MHPSEYEDFCASVDFYPGGKGEFVLGYYALGLTGESGEVADKIKKMYRDSAGVVTDDIRVAIGRELGDALWYLTRIASTLGLTLNGVMELNVAKLTDRRARGVQSGSGDNR